MAEKYCQCEYCKDYTRTKFAEIVILTKVPVFGIHPNYWPVTATLFFSNRLEQENFTSEKDARKWYAPKVHIKGRIFDYEDVL